METRLDWATASHQVGVLSGQIAQLHAEMIQVASQVIEDETWVGVGIRSVEHFLEIKSGLDRHTVRKIVKIARRTEELPELMQSLNEGRITLDQAAVVATHVPTSHSADATEFAQHATVTQLRRGLSAYFHDTDRSNRPDPRRCESTVRLSVTEGQFRLSFVTSDVVAGALVEQAIREAKDSLFTAGNPEATLADGLVETAHRSLAAVNEPSRNKRYQVLVHLDTEGQSWLHKAGALPQHLVNRYTCDGNLVPVWRTEGKPVAVGRGQRIVPDRVRRLIEDRDKGCRFPGCHSTGYLEVHHKDHWRNGGVTDPTNLLCLCSFHHDEHHRGTFTIDGDPERINGLTFRSHRGWAISPTRTQPPPRHDLPPPEWQEISGEPLHTRWLSFRTNPTSKSPNGAAA